MNRLLLLLSLFGALLALAASSPNYRWFQPDSESSEETPDDWLDTDDEYSREDDQDSEEEMNDEDDFSTEDEDSEEETDSFMTRFMPDYDPVKVLQLLKETSEKLHQLSEAQEITDIQDGSGVSDETVDDFVKQFLVQLKDILGFKPPRHHQWDKMGGMKKFTWKTWGKDGSGRWQDNLDKPDDGMKRGRKMMDFLAFILGKLSGHGTKTDDGQTSVDGTQPPPPSDDNPDRNGGPLGFGNNRGDGFPGGRDGHRHHWGPGQDGKMWNGNSDDSDRSDEWGKGHGWGGHKGHKGGRGCKKGHKGRSGFGFHVQHWMPRGGKY